MRKYLYMFFGMIVAGMALAIGGGYMMIAHPVLTLTLIAGSSFVALKLI
jgi:hypothetical protein